MKVPVKKKSGKVKDGIIENAYGVVFKVQSIEDNIPFIVLTTCGEDDGAYFDLQSAKDAVEFFQSLVIALEK